MCSVSDLISLPLVSLSWYLGKAGGEGEPGAWHGTMLGRKNYLKNYFAG